MDYLYKTNKIDDSLLLYAIYPPIDLENSDIIKYYRNAQVRNVLNDIKNNKKTSAEFKSTLSDILNGKSYSEQKEFLASQYSIYILKQKSPANCGTLYISKTFYTLNIHPNLSSCFPSFISFIFCFTVFAMVKLSGLNSITKPL